MNVRFLSCLCLIGLALAGLAVLGAGEALASSWLDDARYARYGTIPPPPPAVRPPPRDYPPLNVESHRFALEHGFQVIELNPVAFPSNRGDMFNYTPRAMIYIAPTPGTSDAGYGRRSIAPSAIFLRPNYSMYNGFSSRRFGRQGLIGPLQPSESQLLGATPRILHFESRGRR